MIDDDIPISHDDLRDLFERLDRASMSGYQCRHTFALTTEFLSQRSLAVEAILEWLGANGAGCDCEVSFNIVPEWEEIVGYVSPDDTE
jgi:hypothetical protein